jgi:hypothetical protein
MKQATVIFSIMVVAAMLFAGCILDPKETPEPPKKVDTIWPDLTEKDDVFAYIEKVYEERAYNRYDLLLDPEFNFRFGDDDYNSGNTDRDWRKPAELNSANKLLNNWAHPQYGAIVQIDLEVFSLGQIWTEIPKNDPPFTGETWYQKSFNYRLETTTSNGTSLRGFDITAFFIIRQSEVDGKNIWRIVQWNDDVGI